MNLYVYYFVISGSFPKPELECIKLFTWVISFVVVVSVSQSIQSLCCV